MSFHTHYWLQPVSDPPSYLRMSETIERIKSAFPRCKIDAEKGRNDTEMRLNALKKLGAPQQVLESYRYPGVYCYLYDDDDDGVWIEFMVWPLQAIGITFFTEEHELWAISLLERLASVLGYEFKLDPDAA